MEGDLRNLVQRVQTLFLSEADVKSCLPTPNVLVPKIEHQNEQLAIKKEQSISVNPDLSTKPLDSLNRIEFMLDEPLPRTIFYIGEKKALLTSAVSFRPTNPSKQSQKKGTLINALLMYDDLGNFKRNKAPTYLKLVRNVRKKKGMGSFMADSYISMRFVNISLERDDVEIKITTDGEEKQLSITHDDIEHLFSAESLKYLTVFNDKIVYDRNDKMHDVDGLFWGMESP